MTPNPLLKDIIKQAVEALEARMGQQKKKKERHGFRLEQIGFRWFGLLPLSIKVARQKRKKL
ncbi:hypothetical protein [Salibacterium sp. K-3]